MLSVISVGGVLGSLARYGLGVVFPHGAAGFPWATFAVNVAGCGLIGVLMVCIDQLGAHRLIRPFLGVGVLGGFTTFSTYVVEVQQAVAAGAARVALAYLGGTLAAAVIAVWAGSALTSTLIRVLTRAGRHGPMER
jgi:CrcB protein